MEALSDYFVYRSSDDRLAELRREADRFRLTRALAEHHAALFPRARKFGAGVIGLAARSQPRGRTPQPCPC